MKDKAKELVNKYDLIIAKSELLFYDSELTVHNAVKASIKETMKVSKQCALICVDEMLESQLEIQRDLAKLFDEEIPATNTFWQEVKQEINNL